jgi:hypothetical protein
MGVQDPQDPMGVQDPFAANMTLEKLEGSLYLSTACSIHIAASWETENGRSRLIKVFFPWAKYSYTVRGYITPMAHLSILVRIKYLSFSPMWR